MTQLYRRGSYPLFTVSALRLSVDSEKKLNRIKFFLRFGEFRSNSRDPKVREDFKDGFVMKKKENDFGLPGGFDGRHVFGAGTILEKFEKF